MEESAQNYSNAVFGNFKHYVYEGEPLFFEKYYDSVKVHQWFERNSHIGLLSTMVYVSVIFGLKRFMKNREPFKLKSWLISWNLMLTIFNLLFCIRTLPEHSYALFNNGLYYATCVNSYLGQNALITDFWGFAFTLSKLVEFGDTIFIVLRKQPLIFLHWYHHVFTLLFGWYGFKTYNSTGRLFTMMNAPIHIVMYGYYTLRAASFRIPKPVSKLITALQITQMFIGCGIHIFILKTRIINKLQCQVNTVEFCFSMFMYFSYLYLFCRFFHQAYINKRAKVLNKSKAN